VHNAKGRTTAQLSTFSGIVSLAKATDLPEGGSPRCQNVDFTVGGVGTRGPLVNPFTYEGNAVGPSPGNSAINVPTGGTPWTGTSNVLSPGGFASSAVSPLTLNVFQTNRVSYQGENYIVFTFDQNVPPYVQGQIYTFSAFRYNTGFNGNSYAPYTGGGIPLTANQQVFAIGGTFPLVIDDHGLAAVSGTTIATDAISITEFAFSVPETATPQGFAISVEAYASVPGATLNVQLMKAGLPVGAPRTAALPVGSALTLSLGSINDLFGASWLYSDLNNTGFGVSVSASGSTLGAVYVGYLTLTAYFLSTQVNFNYVKTFEDSFGNIRTLALDANGNWWVENVNSQPGVLAPLSLMGIAPPGSFASSVTADSRQYVATSNLSEGNYIPQQYTGQWVDRVSQVGPGAAPSFTAISTSATTYAIGSITQPVSHSQGYSYFLQSGGPGSTAPGNVVTIYYLDSTVASSPDMDLVNAFNSGNAVYLWVQFVGGGGGIGSVNFGYQVVQVTSVGLGKPPGQPHPYYYFTFNVLTSQYNFTDESNSANVVNYQRTLATMQMNVPVPGLVIGNQATVSGSSVTGWDAPWTITQTPNSGNFTIITTEVTNGVATFGYTLITGTPPAAAEQVTIVNTNGANGQLNLVNAYIVSASGGDSGTFTVDVSLPNAALTTEEGQATTAGTIFVFDPGAALNGSTTNPIYGTGTGGTLTFAPPSGQFMAPGTRQGTVFFITRNGYYTAPAPPVTFSAAGNSITGIQATNIPLGPPNVIARGIAFTEAGQGGVPGANFFTIPQPVQYTVQDVQYTASSLFINDNTTTSAIFSFSDAILLSAEAIDIPGNNLFNLGELPEAAWCTQYAGRTVWGRVRTKVPNFLNLSFDGGYLANPGARTLPLGWTQPSDGYSQLNVSGIFGNSYYIENTSTAVLAGPVGLLTQSAARDAYLEPILLANTAYSVRVVARVPSGNPGGSLTIALTANGQTYGSYVLPFSQLTTNFVEYSATLLAAQTTIPATLTLEVYASNMAVGADVEIDRMTIFPSLEPVNLTGLTMSYAEDPESFDLTTGGQDTSVVNNQPANGAFTMHDQLYIVKESSLGFLSDAPNQEPANWNPYKEVSNVAGAAGIHAFDVGEEWAVMACQNGLFLFNGGQPIPVQLEIPDLWQAINWQYGETVVVRNDVANRKIYCAVPLATPNPWMVTAAVNTNPTVPNVVLMLNYEGIGDVQELMAAKPMHVTMMGKLVVNDFRRKWSLWTIPTPYMEMVKRGELDALMMFCNGIGSSKMYTLGTAPTGEDDSGPFTSSYCTYPFIDPEHAEANPMFGQWNKRYAYYDLLAEGSGTASLTFYQNVLEAPYPYTVPGGVTLSSPAANDIEGPLNEFAQRLFVEMVMTDGWFRISRVTLAGGQDVWAQIRGK
jgi:hypothetical protein